MPALNSSPLHPFAQEVLDAHTDAIGRTNDAHNLQTQLDRLRLENDRLRFENKQVQLENLHLRATITEAESSRGEDRAVSEAKVNFWKSRYDDMKAKVNTREQHAHYSPSAVLSVSHSPTVTMVHIQAVYTHCLMLTVDVSIR